MDAPSDDEEHEEELTPNLLLAGQRKKRTRKKWKSQERKGKERKGKERKGKERMGKEQKGKERKGPDASTQTHALTQPPSLRSVSVCRAPTIPPATSLAHT